MAYAGFEMMVADAANAPRIESRDGVSLSVFLLANGRPQFFVCGQEVAPRTAAANFEYIARRQ